MLVLAAALLWYTVRRTDADVVAALKGAKVTPLVLAVLLYGFAQILGAWRWQMLLRVQDMRLSHWTALRLTLVGNFFSLIIPGAVTGDVLKIACATRQYPGRAAELTLVVLVDRIIGLSGIFFAAALATIASAEVVWGLIQSDGALVIVLAILAINLGCLGTLVLYILYLTSDKWGRWAVVRWCFQKFQGLAPQSLRAIFQRMGAGLALYRNHQRGLLAALMVSVAIHLVVAGTIFCLGRGLHESRMTAGQYVLTTQLANVTGILPVTPGGIGLRDAVSSGLFQTFGASPASVAGDIPLINSLIIVFWGLSGALVYAISPSLNTHRTHSNETHCN